MTSDDERKVWLVHYDEMRRKTLRALLDERVKEAFIAIEYQKRKAKKEDSFWTRKVEEEWLLRVYTELLETEDEYSQLIAREHAQTEFLALVRAAAAARALMEKMEVERGKGGGFAAGVADALEQRNARARERLRKDDGDGGGVGAALGLAPSPKSAFLMQYEEMLAETKASRATAERSIDEQKKDDDVGLVWS